MTTSGRSEKGSQTVRLLSFDEFCRCERAWDELVLSSESPVPFLCHTWLRLWWRHFGDGQEFVLPVVCDGEELLAAAPLALRTFRLAIFKLTVGEIVGTGPVPTRGMGLADKADLVVRRDSRGARERLSIEITNLLERIDVLDIKGFDATSPTARVLAVAAPRTASVKTMLRSLSPYLDLSCGWEDYLQSRSGNFRKHLKKYWRLMERSGPIQVERLESGAHDASWMERVFAINDASWKAARGTNLFRAPEIRAFFSELIPAMAARGWIDLRLVRLDGEPAVYELCFDFGGRLFSYNGAYRKQLQRFAGNGTDRRHHRIRL